jgi:hypothetical protein
MDDTSIPHIVIPAKAGIHGLSKVKMDLSFTKMDDTSIPHIVIPAKAGIHGLSKVKMDPRFRGDDVSFAENCHSYGNAR